jgi:hypothetical protein
MFLRFDQDYRAGLPRLGGAALSDRASPQAGDDRSQTSDRGGGTSGSRPRPSGGAFTSNANAIWRGAIKLAGSVDGRTKTNIEQPPTKQSQD